MSLGMEELLESVPAGMRDLCITGIIFAIRFIQLSKTLEVYPRYVFQHDNRNMPVENYSAGHCDL